MRPPSKDDLVVVCGAGGFIGGHLVHDLLRRGVRHIRSIDVKARQEWYQRFPQAEERVLDLTQRDSCFEALRDASVVYNLAADMGGMGFIEANRAQCMLNVLINTHLLEAARHYSVVRYFFASSACVYAADKQVTPDVVPLRETDAYPAMPEDGYGWEKLFSERMCRHFFEDFAVPTRVGRYHNVYGPHGTYVGGREKAPAAICRKVAEAKLAGRRDIEIWGDGSQTRTFMYIDDCLAGTQQLTQSDCVEPLNIGSAEMVSINQLVDLVEDIAGLRLRRGYRLDAPTGVRGRSSDNTLVRARLGWEPSVGLREGLTKTYAWVYDELSRRPAS